MAGGEGSRLRPLTSGLPKPLVPVVGRPVMEHILRLLREHGIQDVIVTLRFLEKPSWGEVFSDQVNTGIYVLDPQVLSLIRSDKVVDWSADIFPAMLARKMPLYGHLATGYWCDIGNIQTYYQANWDALAGRVKVEIPGQRREGDVWIGEDVELGHD